LELAELFEPISDFFLTDTLLVSKKDTSNQPVDGFIGITGKICDWDIAFKLVKNSRIPVILAGGISPENVYDGVLKVRPAGVDSCTLTNARNNFGAPVRFKKDPEKVKRLVMAAQNAEKNI
jgi:phosphoribosylanthranilate isomerase